IAESGQRTQILDQVYLGSNLVRLCLTLHITLADDARVQISIYDAAGRCVGKQAIGYLNQGPHIVNMNANDFVSGVYVIKTSVNDRYYYNKCVVLK
ncbi:MAG TPA: T9SS type A sorting domain-containing protein, partial [bacterium]